MLEGARTSLPLPLVTWVLGSQARGLATSSMASTLLTLWGTRQLSPTNNLIRLSEYSFF